MTYREAVNKAYHMLIEAGIEDADIDVWYMMEEVTERKRYEIFLIETMHMEQSKEERFFQLAEKRCRHIPLQYIFGYTEFMGLRFRVNKHVLIPRQETELLVEEASKYAENCNVLDLCTGSGCIIISLKKRCRIQHAAGSDISEEALKVAMRNAAYHQAEIAWIKSNIFENIHQKYDMILSNPPYIETKDISALMPEVRLFEPVIALDGGNDGLLFYKEIIRKAEKHLKSGGRIFFEIGYNQGMAVYHILEQYQFRDIQVKKDYSGNDRIVHAILK